MIQKASKLLLALLLLMGATRRATAQHQAALRVTTNAPEATLFADSMRLGRAGQGFFRLGAGRRRLYLTTPAHPDSWSVPTWERAVQLAPRETLHVDARVPYRYHVASTPYGAGVYVRRAAGRTRLGETPLLYESDHPLRANLVIEKPGYEPALIEPDSAFWNERSVQLVPSGNTSLTASEVDWSPPAHRRTWVDAAAVGVALAAGATAVYYKFKADRLYDDYRDGLRQGDESLRPQFERYDRRSAVALGVMQAGVTVFAVRLFLR